MANVTVVRTASSSQIESLLSKNEALATYLTKVEASSTYTTQASIPVIIESNTIHPFLFLGG
jgi:hypothetical protein